MEDVAKALIKEIPLVGGLLAASITLIVAVRRNNHFMEKIEEANEEILFDLTYAYVLFRLLATATKGDSHELVIAGGATWIDRIFKHVSKVKAMIEKLYVRPKNIGIFGNWQQTVNWNSAESQFRDIKDKLNDLKNDLNSMYEEFDVVTRGVNVVFLEDLMKIFKTLSTNPTKLAGIEQQIIEAEKTVIKNLDTSSSLVDTAESNKIQERIKESEKQIDKANSTTSNAEAELKAPTKIWGRDVDRAFGLKSQDTKGISDTEKAGEIVKVPPAPPAPPAPKPGFFSNLIGRKPQPQSGGGRRKTRRSRRRRSRKGKTIRRKKQ